MTASPVQERQDPQGARGLICSLLLHGVVILLLCRASLPPPLVPPLPVEIPIDLVSLADQTSLPAALQPAARPQLQARETALHPRPSAVPAASPPVAAADPLSQKLQRLAQWEQPKAVKPPSPAAQDGTGLSNVTASPNRGAAGNDARYSIEDYVRAQIEKRWVVPTAALERNDWVVKLDLQIAADGRIAKVQILDDPRLQEDRDFRSFAYSVRNAALLSSPLLLPTGAVELVLDFNPRQVQQ
jgi:hypothetical protein